MHLDMKRTLWHLDANITSYSYATPVYNNEGQSLATRIWNETLEELSFANIEVILNTMI
jgi:hypothetical protein